MKLSSTTAKVCGLSLIVIALSYLLLSDVYTEEPGSEPSRALLKPDLADLLGPYIKNSKLPRTLSWTSGAHEEKIELQYTIDTELQDHTDQLLRRFRPDYAALVAMDASTGEILTMSSYTHKGDDRNLGLVASFPAASIFKMVSAAAAIDTSKATADTIIPFNGRSHTLYRRDVESKAENKWTRYITLREAFSRSVNTFFAKLGLYHVGASNLSDYALRFGFNQVLPADFPVSPSVMHIPPDDDWAVAEAASGFTKVTTLSPLHGALLAAAVANDGLMMEPYLVRRALNPDGSTLYEAEPVASTRPIRQESNDVLKTLMQATVTRGTSRRAFRRILRNRLYKDATFGGKTGSLTGTDPQGRTDWFVGYMQYKDRRIALAAVSVHEKIWRVKSSQLASSYFEQYLYRLITEEPKMAAAAEQKADL